jgi:hypothetical protein
MAIPERLATSHINDGRSLVNQCPPLVYIHAGNVKSLRRILIEHHGRQKGQKGK